MKKHKVIVSDSWQDFEELLNKFEKELNPCAIQTHYAGSMSGGRMIQRFSAIISYLED